MGLESRHKIKSLYEAGALGPYFEQRRSEEFSGVESRRDTDLASEVSAVGLTEDPQWLEVPRGPVHTG